jgi:hypothetical protein
MRRQPDIRANWPEYGSFLPPAAPIVHRARLTRMLRKSLMVFLSLAAVDATLRLTILPQFPEMPVIRVGAC